MLRLAQSSCSRTPTLSWAFHLSLLVSVALPWLWGWVSDLKPLRPLYPVPLYPQLHPVLYLPQKFVGRIAGVFLRILAQLIWVGGGGGQRAVSSSEFRPDPHPSLPLPSQKKSYNTRPLFPNSLFWSPTPFKSNTQPKLRAAGHYTVERRISPGHHGRRIPLLITPNNSVLSWI